VFCSSWRDFRPRTRRLRGLYQDALAATYREALAARRLDNAMVERIDTRSRPTRAAARSAIFAWLEIWYNRRHRHAALAYRNPVAYEER